MVLLPGKRDILDWTNSRKRAVAIPDVDSHDNHHTTGDKQVTLWCASFFYIHNIDRDCEGHWTYVCCLQLKSSLGQISNIVSPRSNSFTPEETSVSLPFPVPTNVTDCEVPLLPIRHLHTFAVQGLQGLDYLRGQWTEPLKFWSIRIWDIMFLVLGNQLWQNEPPTKTCLASKLGTE